MNEGDDLLTLFAAGNTYNPCLVILRDKGYLLNAEVDEDRLIWSAQKAGLECGATSPPELLGMVILAETFGRGWQAEMPDIFGEVLRGATNSPDE